MNRQQRKSALADRIEALTTLVPAVCLECDLPADTHGAAICCVPCGLLFTPEVSSLTGNRYWVRSKLAMWKPAMREIERRRA